MSPRIGDSKAVVKVASRLIAELDRIPELAGNYIAGGWERIH